MVVDCSNMCREATLAFAGHYFVGAFSMAAGCVHYAALSGKSKSLYTPSDEKKDDFMESLKKGILPNVISSLKSATESHALKNQECRDLLKWWFEEVKAELAF